MVTGRKEDVKVDQKYYAHSLPGQPAEKWQPLDEHLKNVAEMARGFAEESGPGEWGCLLRLLHNSGNVRVCFRNMPGLIDQENGKERMGGKISV